MLLNKSNAKTSKDLIYHNTAIFILYLAPSSLSGVNLCPKASPGCIKACLNTAGRGRFASVQNGRMRKTKLYLQDRDAFVSELKREITNAEKWAKKKGVKLAIRLNGTSDIAWERISDIIQSFPNVQFYDYTKILNRFRWPLPANYDLTFSLSETNKTEATEVLKLGGRVAAVFESIPDKWEGYKVINGDNYDARYIDPKGVIVGLKAKGKAKNDQSGFVQRTMTVVKEAA
jgi:hypothetical protein